MKAWKTSKIAEVSTGQKRLPSNQADSIVKSGPASLLDAIPGGCTKAGNHNRAPIARKTMSCSSVPDFDNAFSIVIFLKH